MKKSIDYARNSLANAIETFIPLTGTGAIGQVSSGSDVTKKTITLAKISTVANFEVGMTLKGTMTDGDTLDTGSEKVAAINRSTGELTATSATWSTVCTNLAAGDYLYVEGDGQDGTSNSFKKITGFQTWLPSTP